jgi:SRSO17 transposase
MDAGQIRRLEPMLDEYLSRFSDCFARRDTRAHLPVYMRGQLSDLARKSVEPMALAADVPVRTLQEFLTHLTWDLDRMRDRVVQIVREEHAGPEAIGIIDETGWPKKGDKTPGVQRQYCGAVGKQENCLITVHLGYAAGDFHCLLDSDLYLPKSWDEDRERCREAGIPDEVVYRPKTQIALELYDRARASGAEFEWLTFDEWYASDGSFRRALNARDQRFIGEIKKTVRVWIEPPAVTDRPFRRQGRGRSRRTPRLVAGSPQPQTVEDVARRHAVFRNQRWRSYHIKDTQKGPLVWRVKHALVYLKDAEGLPEGTYHLLVCRSVATGEIKYFLSNAPPRTPIRKLLGVAFERWRVERSFEDGKGELGLDHWEGRKWIGLQRHLVLTAVSYLFLAKSCQELRGEKSGGDRVPGPHSHQRDRAVLVA